MDDLEAMKAAFLARGGRVTEAKPAVAFGVNPDIDKKRKAIEKAERAAFEPCRSCPWPTLCRTRHSCEANG